MAYHEILIMFVAIISAFALGFYGGHTLGRKEVQVIDYQDGYKEGFETAKKMFYEDPKKEREREEQELIERLKKENIQPPRLTPEILMAYGVESSAHLPQSVKEFYGLKNGEPAVDLDYLINEEVTNNDRY